MDGYKQPLKLIEKQTENPGNAKSRDYTRDLYLKAISLDLIGY